MITQENNDSIVEQLEPSTETVDANALLNEIEQYINEHAILPEGASVAIALWCLATFNINSFSIFPKLTITSPEKRCGKSTVLTLIEAYSHKSFMTSNTSTAAIYRLISSYQPTFIIDEADTFIKGRGDEMIGIINSGHKKRGAKVNRCSGDSHEVKQFITWTPMVLASIGTLQSTIMDRSIAIPLERKTFEQTLERIPIDLFDDKKGTREKLLKWSSDNKDAIENNTIVPESLGNERMVDNWIPLFTISKLISDAWFDRCVSAYNKLTTIEEEEALSTVLLSDIRTIFTDSNLDKLPSQKLINELIEFEDHPWEDINLTKHGLAKHLRPYGIKPNVIRIGETTPRGYTLEQFANAFDRYLPPLATV